ncbi:MAG: hypothetical protein SPL57_09085 [Lachnospiraceae bacterium]|jgi:hypothetical protein|nr:hypothetical protein [Lachnospiraceae bacterium]
MSKKKSDIKRGNIDVSDLEDLPEEHEFRIARYFADRGKNVRFIQRSNIPGVHSPDLYMDGLNWEMKSPIGDGKHTVEHIFRKAMDQSKYVIIDLRRCKMEESRAIKEFAAIFNKKPRMRKMLIIKKNEELLEYSK